MEELEQFMGRARRRPLFPAEELSAQLEYGRGEIEGLLPHRGSFLLLDRIVATDGASRVLGLRRLAPSDPVFADHFPGDPVYPGVLLVEMMGQLALTLPALRNGVLPSGGQPPKVRFLRLHDARFIGAALPGDELAVLAELIDDNGYTFLAGGQVRRGDEILAAAVFEAILWEED